jgi:hypothetical protein
MCLLLVGAEIVLPGWWRMFVWAVGQYHGYTQNQSVLEVILDTAFGTSARLGHIGGELLAGIAILSCLPALWKWRREREDSAQFGWALALVLALTVVVVPMYAPYNQVLLVPAILLLIRGRASLLSRSKALRLGYFVAGFLLSWQWLASIVLTAIYLFGLRAEALRGWSWPFFATFALPVCVFVLILFFFKQDELRRHTSGES